jgi:hypothetical protein
MNQGSDVAVFKAIWEMSIIKLFKSIHHVNSQLLSDLSTCQDTILFRYSQCLRKKKKKEKDGVSGLRWSTKNVYVLPFPNNLDKTR